MPEGVEYPGRWPGQGSGAVNYTALSTIPGLMLERTGTNGAGITLSGETSPYTVPYTLPDGKALSDVTQCEPWWSLYNSVDAASITTTAILDDDSELTTSGYNGQFVRQTADGTPAVVSSESYATSNFFAFGASNVAGENYSARNVMMRPNDAVSHKPFLSHINVFKADDDMDMFWRQVELLTTKRFKTLKHATASGTLSGYVGQRMAFA